MTLAQLLVVQAHDSAIDRLTHKRANLPEFAALAMMDDERAHLVGERSILAEKRHQVAENQKSLEAEVTKVTSRIDLENERLYSGSVTAIKDLQLLQEELVVLTGRRSDFEDQILEVMEVGEPLDQGLVEIDDKLLGLEERRVQATESLAASQAEIDAELAVEQAARAQAIEPVAAELMQQYETTRHSCGGVGVARLQGKTCEGCHLQLPSVEIDRIRKEPEEALIRCLECTRILVH